MLETPTAPEWNKARKRADRKGKAQRQSDLFKGASKWEKTTIAGLTVHRLSVIPFGAKTVPQTLAVEHDAKWTGGSAPTNVLENLTWQQSLKGRFDVLFTLPETVRCFALGERFSPLNLRGQVHSLVTADNHNHNEGMDAMYKAIPFLILGDGQSGQFSGVFVDTGAPTRWDLDSELDGDATIEILTRRGWTLYVFGPASLPEIVNVYTTLTGRCVMPPRWALGHQQSRWSYPDEATIREIADEYRARKIPCDAIVIDIDYMDEYRVFTLSKERFPNFKKMTADLDRQNFKVVTIIDPGVKEDADYGIFAEGKKKDLFCTTPQGQVFIDTVWPGRSAFPDFCQEETRTWWAAKHKWFVDHGVAGVWNDMNEPAFFNEKSPIKPTLVELPPDAEQHNCLQKTPEGEVGHFEVRNLYGFLMCSATYDGLLSNRPNERPFVLSRSGFAGIQRYAAVWPGDNMSWFEHLKESIPMLLNLGLSGVPFCGVDIGGFGGDCTPELLVRWYETAIFYPFFRNHSAMGTRAQEPFSYNEKTENLIRNLIETRYRLLPYLQNLFWEARRTGAPIMRPLIWHYPHDDFAAQVDDQFMFGADMLVAPILSRGRSARTVYLPEGNWYPFQGGEPLPGGQTHVVEWPLGSAPAFVREGAIIPGVETMQHTCEFDQKAITFYVYGDTARGVYIEDDGISMDFQTGGYNEWQLEFADGGLMARKVNAGYKIPNREYFFSQRGFVRDFWLT
jgi:alpha-glucosidase